jgi:hypothetical protein
MTPGHHRFIAAPGQALARRDALSLRESSPAALYDDWLLAETQASLELAAWYDAAHGDKAAAYARYAAGTDAEEAAAARLAQRIG